MWKCRRYACGNLVQLLELGLMAYLAASSQAVKTPDSTPLRPITCSKWWSVRFLVALRLRQTAAR